MGLQKVLERGMRLTLQESGDELEAYVRDRGMDDETAAHLRQTLVAIPGLLVAVDGALYDGDAPRWARALFLFVVRYLLTDEDFLPARDDRPLVGLLDDGYLLHRAVQELREHVAGVELRSVDGGAELLARVLPDEVVRLLEDRLTQARREVEALVS